MQKTRVVCVGGGHCNVQVLKQLKKILPDTAKLTLVTDAPRAFYSGMLPGAVSSKL
jgi:NADH dehydrogenase FAD-containing subunit